MKVKLINEMHRKYNRNSYCLGRIDQEFERYLLGFIPTAKMMTLMIIISIMMIIYTNEHLNIKVSPYWSQGWRLETTIIITILPDRLTPVKKIWARCHRWVAFVTQFQSIFIDHICHISHAGQLLCRPGMVVEELPVKFILIFWPLFPVLLFPSPTNSSESLSDISRPSCSLIPCLISHAGSVCARSSVRRRPCLHKNPPPVRLLPTLGKKPRVMRPRFWYVCVS